MRETCLHKTKKIKFRLKPRRTRHTTHKLKFQFRLDEFIDTENWIQDCLHALRLWNENDSSFESSIDCIDSILPANVIHMHKIDTISWWWASPLSVIETISSTSQVDECVCTLYAECDAVAITGTKSSLECSTNDVWNVLRTGFLHTHSPSTIGWSERNARRRVIDGVMVSKTCYGNAVASTRKLYNNSFIDLTTIESFSGEWKINMNFQNSYMRR